ncbi:hypothetical protein N8878_08460, partial [Psychromonas sp.]|nr:hypothetical protein [Psychromonas sp.]
MDEFKKSIFAAVMMLTMITSVSASALNISTKPAKITIYLEEASPFSSFNYQQKPEGMLVDYWKKWSKSAEIDVRFKPYSEQNLNYLLSNEPASLYSGFHLHDTDLSKLDSFPFISLSSDFYYFSKNTSLIKMALSDKTTRLIVGGLLPKANLLPFFLSHPNVRYKQYTGLLELLVDLYAGDIDTFSLFEINNSTSSIINKFLPYLLSHTDVDSASTAFYVYGAIDNKNLLPWVKWGTEKEELQAQLSGLLGAVTASEWGISEVVSRFLLGLLLLFLFGVLIKRSKKQKNQQFKDLLESSPYPLVICSLDGRALYFTNDEAKSMFTFKRVKKAYLFDEEENQLLLSRFINRVSHQSVIEECVIRLLVGTHFYDIEISAKRIHYQRESAWLCYFKNVTDLLKAQKSLNEERELLRKVLDSIPEQISFKAVDGQIIGC